MVRSLSRVAAAAVAVPFACGPLPAWSVQDIAADSPSALRICLERSGSLEPVECVISERMRVDTSGAAATSAVELTLPTSRRLEARIRFADPSGCLVWNHTGAEPTATFDLLAIAAPAGVVAGSRITIEAPCFEEWRSGSPGGNASTTVRLVNLSGDGAANVALEMDGAPRAVITSSGGDVGALVRQSAAIKQLPQQATSTGPNYVMASPWANMLGSTNYQSAMLLAAGQETQQNYMRAPDLRPVNPHPAIGRVTHTTTGTSDDTGAEICANGAINTFGYGACVAVDDNQDGTFGETCAAALGTGNAVNVRCGAGAIGSEMSYSTILGGYDNHVNHQAAYVLSQHSSIGPGDAGGHSSIFGGSSHFIEGDCEFGTILGGATNSLWCDRTASNTSKANTIVGSLTSRIDSENLTTFNFDSSFNAILASQDSVIEGASFGGAVVAGIRSGIIIDDAIGSASVSDEARNNRVTGTGSAVRSFDRGTGSHVAPSYASASGLGARTWQDNQECHGVALASDTAEGTISGVDGSGGATAQVCRFHLTNFNIAAGNPTGTFTSLFTDRAGTIPIVFTEDGVWSVDAEVVCAERNTTNPNRHFTYQTLRGVIATSGITGGSGTASFYDSGGSAVSTVAGTVIGGRETSAGWAVSSQLAARADAGSLDGGFDVQVRVDTGGDTAPAAMECAATVDVIMIRDL